MLMQQHAKPFLFRPIFCGPLTLVVLFSGILVGTAHSESVTGKNSHNGVALFGRSRVAFETATGVVRDSIAEGPNLALPALGPAAEVRIMDVVMPDPPITPGDEARIDLLNRFEFGTPFGSVPDDRWTFRVEGTASAVDAQLGGSPADAIVSAFGTASFFVDPITAPVGTTIGQIVLDEVRPLTAKEAAHGAIISLLLREDGATILTLGPGSPSIGHPLVVGRSYELVANYNLIVPHGMDPPFLVELDVTIAPPLVPGDFDGDGDVDGADFVAWQTHFPTTKGATLADGDADGDGDVDGADFVVWQTNFPFLASPGASPVPEPVCFSLALVAAAGLLLVRQRCRV